MALAAWWGSENRVLTTEARVFAHVVVGEGLYVAFGVALAPRHVRGDLATTLPLGNSVFEQLALLAVYREAGDCRPTHVVVRTRSAVRNHGEIDKTALEGLKAAIPLTNNHPEFG